MPPGKGGIGTSMRQLLAVSLAGIISFSLCACGQAYPIVTTPTATMVADGQAYLNYYWVDTRIDNPYAPQYMQIGSAYIGLNRKLELDLTYVKPERVDGTTTITAQYLVLPESRTQPAVVFGAEDITREGDDTSLYIAAAKTVTPVKGRVPTFPLVRLNLGYGTEPRSAFFGGLQVRFNREWAAVALSDGHDSIYALTYTVPKTGLTLKAGTLGDARWLGVEYKLPFR